MSWLKSPWFWIILVLALVAIWLLFFRPAPARSGVAPTTGSTSSTWGFFGGLVDSIVSRFNTGDSIMAASGSR